MLLTTRTEEVFTGLPCEGRCVGCKTCPKPPRYGPHRTLDWTHQGWRFVATNIILSRQAFVATKVCLSRQTRVCCDKYLSRQKFCCAKHTFVATKDVFCRNNSPANDTCGSSRQNDKNVTHILHANKLTKIMVHSIASH